VRACTVGDQVILLDLRRNRYLSVGGHGMPTLEGQVRGWPANVTTLNGPMPAPVRALAERLTAQGLLTDAASPATHHPTVEEATASLDTESADVGERLAAGQVIRFLQSATASALRLRLRSLDAIATSVAATHARIARSDRYASRADTLRIAATYERLRPFALTAEDKCLQDSLALMAFLAAEGATARWVIGVKTRPFGAHSWVQLGPTVLNDQHARVRHFTPILVV
jgi:hypothetical protein